VHDVHARPRAEESAAAQARTAPMLPVVVVVAAPLTMVL